MDIARLLLVGAIVVAVSLVGGFLVNMTRSAFQRRRATRPQSGDAESEARLARIETAVEAIAIEVERIGEMQRFSAKLDAARLETPRSVERPVTPH